MHDEAQILIARLLAHQTLAREDKLVRRALSDELFRTELDTRLAACGLKLLDNVYADHVALALAREVEPKVFGAREVWQNNNLGLARDGVALLVVLWALIILPKRERQHAHQQAQQDQDDMFDADKPMPRASVASVGVSYRALLADFGDKLGRKTRFDMNLGQLNKLGFIERRGDAIVEGPLLDLMMDTDLLRERVVDGALADILRDEALNTAQAARAASEALLAPLAPTAAPDAAIPTEGVVLDFPQPQ
ncbi:MAG: hypothetical protein JWP36_2610 [Paucimonas sp.]|nr:hypothetical protein [Paucimonas sp.]